MYISFLRILLRFVLMFMVVPCVQGASFTVVIDAGHGGKDVGAKGFSSYEKNINLAVALKLGEFITTNMPEVKVIYTRKNDRFIELDERANIANRNKADLFISIHTNSVKKGSSVHGAETYTLGLARSDENLEVAMRENSAILFEDNYEQRYEGFDPNSSESYIIFEFMQNKHMEQSVNFASDIQSHFKTAKIYDRGVRQAGFLVLRKTSMPSVLIELGFISNRTEEKYMNSERGQKELASCIYRAFKKYKEELDRKAGMVSSQEKQTVSVNKDKEINLPEKSNSQQVVYKIQILTSDKNLASNSKMLKGYHPVDVYKENGLYKYTYGESTNFNEIKTLYRKVVKDFTDAFIIKFRNGKKI